MIPSTILDELKMNSFLALGYSSPNPPVACVITDESYNILASSHTQKVGSYHAERDAYEKLGKQFDTPHLIFITLEPCSHFGRTPPCIDLIVSKKPKKVILGELDPNPLVKERDSLNLLLNHNIVFEFSNELKEISNEFISGFFYRIQKKRPRIIMKSALSREGFYKTKDRVTHKISGIESDLITQCIRQSVDGVIVGNATVMHDTPNLNFRGIKNIYKNNYNPKDLFFQSLLNLIKNEGFIKIINERNNQPYRIFILSNKYFPSKDFFTKQKNLGRDKTIFILADKLSVEKMELISNATTNDIYYSISDSIKDTIIHISNSFGLNNLLVEGGNSLYKLFLESLNEADKIIEINSNTSIPVGEKPSWHDNTFLSTRDRFQINEDTWEIKGL